MAFFVKFPALVYDLDIPTGKKLANPRIVTDIFKRIIIKRNLQEAATIFTKYIVKDEDTAEIIAHKLYGSAGLHWLVYLPNEIINPFFDWPLSERKLVPFIGKKYPGSTFFLDPSQIFIRLILFPKWKRRLQEILKWTVSSQIFLCLKRVDSLCWKIFSAELLKFL